MEPVDAVAEAGAQGLLIFQALGALSAIAFVFSCLVYFIRKGMK